MTQSKIRHDRLLHPLSAKRLWKAKKRNKPDELPDKNKDEERSALDKLDKVETACDADQKNSSMCCVEECSTSPSLQLTPKRPRNRTNSERNQSKADNTDGGSRLFKSTFTSMSTKANNTCT